MCCRRQLPVPACHVHVERFAPHEVDASNNTIFEAMLARSGRRVHVPVGTTILEVVREAGGTSAVLSTCTKGTCGTCEVKLVNGVTEHRDAVLTTDEKAAQTSNMLCVSRCRGRELSLDLWWGGRKDVSRNGDQVEGSRIEDQLEELLCRM